MKRINIFVLFFLLVTLLTNTNCKKFLDEKSNQTLSTPETLADLQALADNFNANFATLANNNMSDEYYLDYSFWEILDRDNQKIYRWDADANVYGDWGDTYKRIFDYNTVLDNLADIDRSADPQTWDAIRGTALFFRAYFHSRLADLYGPQYDPNGDNTEESIPLRLTSDFNIESKRSTVKEVYDQVIKDFTEAAGLLRDNLPTTRLYKFRPTKVATYAMLAKTYLQMGDYQKAFEFSGQALSVYDELLDFNSSLVDTSSQTPFPTFDINPEIIFYIRSNGPLNSYDVSFTDPALYASFDDADLRKQVYFGDLSGLPYYKGPYTGTIADLFNGIATDEVYLIRAETAARIGNAQQAMDDLNTLLSTRYRAADFIPYSGLSAAQLLPIVLEERKKELVGRGTKWADLRRLNLEPAFAVTIKRDLNGQEYVLGPNDLRYTLLIPNEVMIKTDFKQNPR